MTDFASSNNNNNNNNLASTNNTSTSNKNPSSTGLSNVNYVMRKERSLDRSSATENFLENLGFVTNISNSSNTNNNNTRRSYTLNSSQPTTPQHLPSYNNSTLYLNSNQIFTPTSTATTTTSSRIHRPHQRSNSILNGTNQLNLLNPLNFTRDYGTSVSVGGGLRASARAQSTNSFSINNLQRETSGNSIKSMLNSNTSDLYSHQYQQQQQQQQPQQPISPTNQTQVSNSKLNFIKDLQIRLMDMQKECYFLRCELDTNQQKLTSSMQSIKQFWSPELKRERQLRKEETSKYTILLEQYKLLQSQYQTLLETYEQQSIQFQQMQQMHQHDDLNMNNSVAAKQVLKEKTLLKKTISELEMRINAQKQSLNTKDETIKKLFQMIKTISNKNSDLGSSMNNKNELVRINLISVF